MRLPWLVALVVALALSPQRAHAHAAIVSSDPEPGQQLPTAPGVVVLRFSEPINTRLSRASVTDPAGRRFDGVPSALQEIRARLATSAPGVYRVEWKTVSPVDGHTLSGSFRFGVRVDPGRAEGAVGVAPQPADLQVAIARAIEYGALLMAVGMLLLGFLARRSPPLNWVRFPLPAVLGIATASGIIVVAGEALVAAPTPSLGDISEYLKNGFPAAARLARLGAEITALALVALRPSFASVPLLGALAALAGSGHAASIRPIWWGVAADLVHLVAAGLWAGGILALATVRPPGGWRSPGARTLLERFRPVAIGAFTVTVGFGVVRSAQELRDVGDLLTSSYGQVLMLKVAAVVAMAPLSLLAWRRRVSPGPEAGIAVVVIGVAALLAAYPLPPARIAEAEAAREGPAIGFALPREGDLTIAAEAGDTLVGLTVRPGIPGRNQILVFVLPPAGEVAAPTLPVELSVGGRAVRVESCGSTCRSAEADLQGGERVEVRVEGSEGGAAAFRLPDLPAADGSELLARMRARMRELRALRIEETLGPTRPPVRAEYALQAPDRLRQVVDGGGAMIWIGTRRYLKDVPGTPWREQDTGFALPVPSFVWDPPGVPRAVAPRLLGAATVDGVNAEILSFFGDTGSIPIWFRLWVDGEGLVRRAEMHAQGHFMQHRYSDFDVELGIEPPG